MNAEAFEGVLQWANEKKDTRHVRIKIDDGNVSTWVYDYGLQAGQFVQNAAEIDLLAVRKKQLLVAVAELESMEKG